MIRVFAFLASLMVFTQNWEVQAADPPPLNAAILKYCESKEGKRVGSGECSHLANEALRVAGAEFTQVGADGKRIPDSPSKGDYVWGTRVKTYSFDDKANKLVDSDPKVKCLPGDVLQYRNVKISDGTQAPHHTAIVRTVDDAGNPTGVYQQNVQLPKGGDGRIVQKSPLRTLKMTSGQLMVYRPEKPTNPEPIQFTWTNNSKANPVEFTYCGKKGTLGGANTAEGYSIVWASKGADSVEVGGKTYPITTRKAYEFYTTSEGQVSFREIR